MRIPRETRDPWIEDSKGRSPRVRPSMDILDPCATDLSSPVVSFIRYPTCGSSEKIGGLNWGLERPGPDN